jgi:hypothetical protein
MSVAATCNGKSSGGPALWLNIPVIILMLGAVLCSSCRKNASASDRVPVIREDFQSLADWEAFSFQDIEKKTEYSIVPSQGESLLQASSNSSASAIVHTKRFSVSQAPILAWRWKVSRVYDRGNVALKQADDVPLRVYVLFEYDPERAGLAKRLKYALAKALYGEYPPDSSLGYIWANQRHEGPVLTSPYTEQAKMIPLQSGEAKVGTWQEEQRNILEDYRTAFGREPPKRAALAVMNDSDNTGEASLSYLDWIVVREKAD